MLTSALLGICTQFLQWVISIRPNWTPQLDPTVSTIISNAEAWNSFVPVNAALAASALYLTLSFALTTIKWAVKFADWVADIIP